MTELKTNYDKDYKKYSKKRRESLINIKKQTKQFQLL